MPKPLLIIIGADKGGVGKTTVARAVLDYFNASAFKFRAFDSETPKGVLKRFFPRETDIIDLASVPDQMKVFDTLGTDCVTVIDVCAGMLSPTLKTLGDVGLYNMVSNGDVDLIVLHVLGASVASLDEVKETAAIIKGAKHILVKNHINDSSFFDWDATRADVMADKRDGLIDIPQLTEMAAEHIDVNATPFRSFIANENAAGGAAQYSMVLRGHAKTWLTKVFAEFDRVGLNTEVNAAMR